MNELVLEKFVGSGKAFAAGGADVILQTFVDLFDVAPEFVLLGKILRTYLGRKFYLQIFFPQSFVDNCISEISCISTGWVWSLLSTN